MRRVLGYHLWHANWWEEQAFARTDLSPEEAEEAAAYAFRQSCIRIAIHDHCQSSWADVARYVAQGEGIERSGLLGFGPATRESNNQHENGSASPSPARDDPRVQQPLTPTRAETHTETAIPTPSPTRIQHPFSTPASSRPGDATNTTSLFTPTRSGSESAARAAPTVDTDPRTITENCGADKSRGDINSENVMDLDWIVMTSISK